MATLKWVGSTTLDRRQQPIFSDLIEPQVAAAYRLALAILGDEEEARDAAQDAMLAAWRHWSSLRDVASDGLVAAFVQQTTSSNFSVADLLVSRAGGAFAERRAPAAGRLSITGAGELWLAGGVAGNQLWRSADAGLTWTEIRLPPTLGTTIGVSAPLRIADRLILPVTINGPATREAWLTSNDSGATWQQLALISVGGDTGPGVALPASAAGDRVLVAGSLGRLFAVTAGGQSPAPVSPNGLPQVVTRLQFSSSSAGWALTTTAGCVSGKSQCFSVTRVFTTRDGGQTWNQTKLPG